MPDREDEIQEAYEQGERDGAESKDAGIVGGLATILTGGLSNSYRPPSDPEEKEAYDKGFDNASR